jgi:hypothetical protein
LQGLLKEGKHYASFKEFCKDSPGVAAAYRAIELRVKSEARFKEETHDAQGLRLVQAKEALRRVSHMGSLQDIEDHWECIMGTEQETRQPQFFGTLLMDVHRSLELVYAQNLEIMEALNRANCTRGRASRREDVPQRAFFKRHVDRKRGPRQSPSDAFGAAFRTSRRTEKNVLGLCLRECSSLVRNDIRGKGMFVSCL